MNELVANSLPPYRAMTFVNDDAAMDALRQKYYYYCAL